jgi:hypothetical protein
VDLDAINGGDTPINNDWYGNGQPERDETGFFFSRLVGGARPAEGTWPASGGSGARTETTESGSQWANVTDVRVLGGRSFVSGKTIKMRYVRGDRDSNANVRFLLDRDQNPLNNNFVRTLRSTNLRSADDPTANRSDGSTNGAAAGTYWVCARITDAAGHTRYAYSKSFKLTNGAGRAAPQAFVPAIAATSNAASFSSTPIKDDAPLELLA